MNNHDSSDQIEYIRTEVECKSWNNEEIEELNSSLKICCVPLPRKMFLFVKYIIPTLTLLVSFAADTFSNIAVAVRHYQDNHIWWFSLTILFICAPVIMFVAHAIVKTIRNKDYSFQKKLLWIFLYLCTGGGFLLWPLWGYVSINMCILSNIIMLQIFHCIHSYVLVFCYNLVALILLFCLLKQI